MVSPNSPDGTRVCGQALGLSALSVPLLPKPLDQEKVPADVALWQILAGSPGLAIQLAGILPQ